MMNGSTAKTLLRSAPFTEYSRTRRFAFSKQSRRLTKTTLWTPLEGPQTDALLSEADELFYGGAAGGGKTDLLIGLALTRHRKSIIFRREYPQIKDVIERSKEIVGNPKLYNGQDHVWRNLPGSRSLEFGAVQYEDDKNKYKGRPHDLKAFDELPDFTESQYLFLSGWLRTTARGQRTRIVGAGNPPTSAEGEWVIRRWGAWLDWQHPNPAKPGEIRWYARVDDEDVEREDGTPFVFKGETVTPKSRTFIPARLSDNPYLLATDYGATLQNMPEPLRSQLLYGSFQAGLEDNPWQVIPTEWVRKAQERWRAREKPAGPMSCLGVDVARGGKDKTVLAARYDNWLAPLIKYSGRETPDGPSVAAVVAQALGDEPAPVNIDAIGVGTSPLDILKGNGVDVRPINNAESADLKDPSGKVVKEARDRSDKYKLRNVRAASYWRLREALDPKNGDELALPPDQELLADLCAPRWSLSASGITVESKEEIAKRLGRSPDCGDAVALAHYIKPTLPKRTLTTIEI